MPESLFWIKLQARKEILAQVFYCEFCKISKNIFSYRTPPVAASEYCKTFRKIPRKTFATETFFNEIVRHQLY